MDTYLMRSGGNLACRCVYPSSLFAYVLCVTGLWTFVPTLKGASAGDNHARTPQPTPSIVNYVKLYNQTFGRGVTTQNNAIIPILILGRPDSLELSKYTFANNTPVSVPLPNSRARFCRALGMTQKDLSGPRYLQFNIYCQLNRQGLLVGSGHHARLIPKIPYYINTRFIIKPWGEKLNPWLATWLHINGKVLDEVVDASRRPRFFVPIVPWHTNSKSINVMINDLNKPFGLIMDMAHSLEARAMLELRHGQISRCESDLLAVHRFSELVTQEHTLIAALVGNAIGLPPCSADVSLADSGKLSTIEALAYLKRLHDLPRTIPLAEVENTTSRWESASILRQCETHRKLTAWLVKSKYLPAEALHWKAVQFQDAILEINSLQNHLVGIYRIGNQIRRAQDFAVACAKWKKSSISIEQGFATMVWQNRFVLAAVAWRTAYQRLVYLALALAAYRSDHGAFPASLASLVPNYLRQLPHDPFTGKPFTYTNGPHGCKLSSTRHFSPTIFPRSKMHNSRPIVVQLHSH